MRCAGMPLEDFWQDKNTTRYDQTRLDKIRQGKSKGRQDKNTTRYDQTRLDKIRQGRVR